MSKEKIKIDKNKCVGCRACVKTCPYDAVYMEGKLAVIDYDKCVLCGACVESCKFNAIKIDKTKSGGADKDLYKDVWVFCEQKEGDIQHVSYELLGAGRKLADKRGSKLCGVLIGNGVSGKADSLFNYHADIVYVADDERLNYFKDDIYSNVMLDLINRYKPEIVLAGATTIGRALMPRIAVILKAGLTADCTGLDIDDSGNLLQTRPAYGGNIMATILCPYHRPQMATVRPKVMKVPDKVYRKGTVKTEKFSDSTLSSNIEVIEIKKEEDMEVPITEADIIVTGGRGLQKKDNFSLIRDLAEVLNAAIGSSRGAVEKGWIAYSHQVGQTGKTVCPKLYIAVGVSGAVQHLVGMQSSQKIIAINKDPYAPIFNVADYGIVGDLFEVVPKLISEIKRKGVSALNK